MIMYAIVGDPDNVNPSNGADSGRREALGVIGYLEVNTQHRTLETGGVLFSPVLQRSAAATEAHYLLLRSVCEPADGSPGFRRIAWMSNHLNTASRRAAERLGYVYEGTWRNHMLDPQKRSRDSDWLSILDDEWPVVKAALEKWLEPGNFDESGKQIRTLEEIRSEFKSSMGS